MNEQKISLNVAKDLYLSQVVWTYAFLGILFIVNIVKIGYAAFKSDFTQGFFNTSFIASNFYMFIIGLMAAQFLAYFVGNGVTRKDYFYGNVLSSIGLSLTIAISTSIIFLIEKFILNLVNIPYKAQTINEIELDGNILGDVIQMMIISPYVDPNENVLLATIILATNIFIFYILGWMISISFYRYGAFYGIISVLFAIGIKLLKDNLIRITLDLPTIAYFENLPDMPIVVAIFGVLLIIIVIFHVIHTITKRVPVKL